MGRTGPRCRPELASDAREVPTSAPMRPRLPPAVGWRGRGRGSRRAGRAARPSGSVTCIRQPHHSGQWHWRPAGRPRSPSPSASAWSPPGPGVSGCQGEGPARWGSCMPRGGGGGDRALALPERGGGGSGRPRGQCRTLLCPTSALALSPLQSPVTCVLPKAWVTGFAFIPLRGDVTLSFHRWRLARHGQARPWGGGAPGRRPGGKEVASTCSGGVPCGQVQWGPGATPAGPHPPWNRGRKIHLSHLSSLN